MMNCLGMCKTFKKINTAYKILFQNFKPFRAALLEMYRGLLSTNSFSSKHVARRLQERFLWVLG